jgi:uncharacterized membrane protein HdeD (DUF308 family)
MNRETTNDPRTALQEGERMVARVWRLLALRGVLAIVFAFVLLVWPDIGLTAMVTVVGAFAIASGFVSGVAAYALPGAATQHRLWLALNSLVGLGVGTAVLVWPDLSATALLYAIAIWAIATGVIELVAAFALVRGTFDVALAVELRRVLNEFKERIPSPIQPKPVVHG